MGCSRFSGVAYEGREFAPKCNTGRSLKIILLARKRYMRI
jgi:hypothetical protein